MKNGKILPKSVKKYQFKFQVNLKSFFIWLLVAGVILSFFISFPTKSIPTGEEIPLSQALAEIKDNKIKEVKVEEDKLILISRDEKTFFSRKETQTSFTDILKTAEINPATVNLTIKDVSLSKIWMNILGGILPIALMVLFFFFIFRQARGAQDSIFSFGRSKAQLFAKGKQAITFKDVAGVDEAKKELQEVVDFLKHPGKYRKLGARTPKGVLLVGPSGTGKTLLAKAVAGEANVSFFSMAGSEFMEMLVGVGASRVRDLFSNAKKAAPSIIFIDEIDAIGRQRGLGFTGGHDEREQTLNQILVEMDGFTPSDNVIILSATNRGDLLDPALLRPGRFDRRVVLDMPDVEDRKAILAIHARGKPFVKEVKWENVARRTVGFSGADLENMLNEAAILAARENRNSINVEDIEEAATKVKLGPEKKRLQSEEERKMTAYHEAGHAVVSFVLPHIDPVHRISIVSRGIAMGFTLIPPKKDRYTETKSHLLETIATLLGGRAAEELIFNEFTGGAASDIDQATRIARQMVVDFGMSSLGPTYLGPQIETTEWGRSWMQPSEISPDMQAKVDREIKKIVDESYQKALEILKKSKKKLDIIAEKLVKQETLEGEEFEKLMKKN
ncbi:cell division protein FtsH [Candidatus Woesebacteria bacterium CG_4_10_14_0_2_um_filter_39_14]|uniref:ATP-dependent zinc metalloprotease FtsH n=3 Tax=Microgenomates group TaxID=1794810 RepID=A0A2M6YQJ1_9BACT|nr:MAG: cell division protein FtsH [Candidatus Shapirobacteria bacterium CG07_land_8_20_14_0_80_39_12]PIZ46741.1 MAG: cell division protein FtsH [Candidatus Woesebacteria bacterium CG_4_10_14_0_2_um_filter_39_14]PJA49380.1 MAG: cell division protein FtsH [Candidatus Shapirobacteria bacterium CG_4_9_14_3_um_filter_39_13]